MHLFQSLAEWWHQLSWLEIIAVITGLICVYLAAINSIWNWPIAIISTVITVYLMATRALYADMLQYSYLTIINIYGWYIWSNKRGKDDKRPVIAIAKRQIIYTTIAAVLITPSLGFMLIHFAAVLHYAPPAYPYLDSFCTVVSLAAQVLMARKVVENWLIWIFVDIIYVIIYTNKDLEAFAFMFVVYIIIALIGYFDWKKELKKLAVK
ncbi:nicotinamide riboside transporter PnuC [Mucilaginibacter yixingensis]|nr:nicotinamide riboside transporter PnuC [Mucilaginibacter yixingensis]